jgi:hypothetical protein
MKELDTHLPADLLQGKRADMVEQFYDEGGFLAHYEEHGKPYSRWENPSGGVIINYSGMTQVWMRLADPGVYYNAAGQEVPEREAQRAGFNTAYWRGQRRAAQIQAAAKSHADKIRAESAEHLKTEEDKRRERAEALREAADKATAKVVREHAKQVQAEADKQRTSWLDAEPPTA